MLQSERPKFPIVSLVVCFVAVLVLCGLGVWQIERLQWKNNLQQNLDMAFAEKLPPMFFSEELRNSQRSQVVRGTAQGHFDISKAIFFHGRIQDGKSVLSVIVPMTIPSLGEVVPVELGCAEHPKPQDILNLQNRAITIVGILRQPIWSFATPANSPEKGEWWRVDPKELSDYWKIRPLNNAIITVENTSELAPALNACPIEKKLRNDHAAYAFFWFTMAGVLSVIWGIRFLKPYLQSA